MPFPIPPYAFIPGGAASLNALNALACVVHDVRGFKLPKERDDFYATIFIAFYCILLILWLT